MDEPPDYVRLAEEFERTRERRFVSEARVDQYSTWGSPDAPTLRARTRLTSKNQVTLPVAMVRALEMGTGAELELELDYGEEGIMIRKKLPRIEALRRLRGSLAGVWRGVEDTDNYVRTERDSWDREWDENKPSGTP